MPGQLGNRGNGQNNIIPGHGRNVGSKNKPKHTHTHGQMIAAFEALNFDPLKEAVALYRDPELMLRDKVILIKDIMSYTYARRRSVEVAGDVTNNTLNIQWNASDKDVIPLDSTITVEHTEADD